METGRSTQGGSGRRWTVVPQVSELFGVPRADVLADARAREGPGNDTRDRSMSWDVSADGCSPVAEASVGVGEASRSLRRGLDDVGGSRRTGRCSTPPDYPAGVGLSSTWGALRP